MAEKTGTITLPYPPPQSKYYGVRNVRGAPTWRLKRDGSIYQTAAQNAAREQPRIAGPVFLRLILTPPDRRRNDLPFIVQALTEALAGLAFEDTRLIEALAVQRFEAGTFGASGRVVASWRAAE